jgi:hypothetical protein
MVPKVPKNSKFTDTPAKRSEDPQYIPYTFCDPDLSLELTHD